MPLLLIETSTERSIVGIVEKGKILFEKQLPLGLNHTHDLAPTLVQGLQELGMTIAEMDGIGVGIGPGSYTGIRVGAIFSKSLAFGVGIPLIGISTLECFVPNSEGPFLILLDAKISGVYYAVGHYENGKGVLTTLPQVASLEKIGAIIENFSLIVTPKAKSLQIKLGERCPRVVWQELPPSLVQMDAVVDNKLKAGFYTQDGTLELLYLRKTQAEIEKEEKQKFDEGIL
ncbi:MAG: tRNA (adenosine(37)-N6)-threonylcarbamoyltransferase complex dimerization subunit type 1 TsaB [Parachlamydiaceae bacterium]